MKGKVKALLNKLSDRYEAKKGSGKKANDEFGYYKRGRGKLAKLKGVSRLTKRLIQSMQNGGEVKSVCFKRV